MTDQPTPEQIRTLLQNSANQMAQNGELFEHLNAQVSQLLFHRYKTLVDAGFTPDQAIKIVCERGLA